MTGFGCDKSFAHLDIHPDGSDAFDITELFSWFGWRCKNDRRKDDLLILLRQAEVPVGLEPIAFESEVSICRRTPLIGCVGPVASWWRMQEAR